MELSNEQLQTFKSMYLPDASDTELKQVQAVCKSKQLDPFAGDVIFRRQSGKIIDITTIDAARRRATRTGEYLGTSDPEFHEDQLNGLYCRITAYRNVGGQRAEFTARRYMKETKASGPVWQKSPLHMLEKATEMLALRKAFPEHLGSSYEESEPFHSEETEARSGASAVLDTESNAEKWKQAVQGFAVFGVDEADMMKEVGDKSVDDLTEDDFAKLREWYNQCKK